MAEDDNEQQDQEKPAGGLGNKKKLLLLIGLAVIVAGLSVGGTLAVLSLIGGDEPEQIEEEVVEEEAPVVERAAIYYPLKPPIVVTYEVRGRQRYAQADITLLTRDEQVVATIETHMPMIRDALVMIIGGKIFEEVQTAEGKELLRQECLQELQRLIEKEIGTPGIEQVLFTNFVMQ